MIRESYIWLAGWLDPFFLIYFGIINLFYAVLLPLGSIKIFHRYRVLEIEDFTHLLKSNSMAEITFIVAAYNEEKNIQSMAEGLINLSYRHKQILIVNDGSKDATFAILHNRFNLIAIPKPYKETIPTARIRGIYRSISSPELFVIDKENGTKYDALNVGINFCETDYFICVDADTYVDEDSFKAIIRPLLTFPETIGIGAAVRIRNGCTLTYNRVNSETIPFTYVTGMQTLEYLRSFIMRQGWDYLGGNFIIAGAFSIFSTKVVKELGGYAPTVANDLEIVLRLNRAMLASHKPYRIYYLPDPVAWTEGPTTLKALGKQRFTWERGTLESIWFNKCLFFNPKYKRYGLVVFPFLVLGEALEPHVELIAYIYLIFGIGLGVTDPIYALLVLSVIWGFTILYTFACIFIEELSFRKYTTFKSIALLSFYTLIEFLGYRQLSIFWKIRGALAFTANMKENNKSASAITQLMKKFLAKRSSL